MRYLILDPLGPYAGRIMHFLGGLGHEAVAVFTSAVRQAAWERKWVHRLGHLAGAHYLAAPGTDLRKLTREIDRDWPDGFAGIIPWDEMTILLGAEIGELLDLEWNPSRVIERCRNKLVMKNWLRRSGKVRINASRKVSNADEAFAFQEEVDAWPIVVKPTSGAGARDVYFADNRGELLRYCQQVLENGAGDVLLEEFVGGQEFAVNGIADREGTFLVTDVWLYDKRESHGIPNLYYQTIKLGRHPVFWDLASYAADVVEALELRRAPVHMEVKLDENGPCLIELGARFAGGDQPVLASKLHGRSLFELAACHYLAELPFDPHDVDYDRYDELEARIVSGIQPYEIQRVSAIHGLDEVRELPSFEGFGFLWPPGTRVPVTRDLDTKSYELYLMHPDPRQIEHDAQMVRRLFRYE